VSLRLVHGERPATVWIAWRLALNGDWPAEALSTADRARLVRILHKRGWTDVEIAVHTRMTTYTTGRIRARLGLAPNTSVPEVA
jgi:hypothetical protein